MILDTPVLLALVPLLPVLVWLYMRFLASYYRQWEMRGVPAKPSSFPFGSSRAYIEEKEFQALHQQKMYNEFSGHPYFGIYAGSMPFLVLRDPEYIRIVMAKEFSHFRDRQGFKIGEDDHLAKHLFALEGDFWRALRIKMSPAFTSGKLKAMFPFFVKCAQDLDQLLLENVDKELNVKDSSARFSTDVICSCAFGWEVNSLGNADNHMRRLGKEFMEFKINFLQRIKLIIFKYIPYANNSPPRITTQEMETTMINAVKATVEDREKTGKKRNDFIDLLIQMKNKGILNEEGSDEEELKQKNIEPVELTIELMTAQCFVFFLAGFETSSSVQTFCLYELALHEDIQERLHVDITETLAKHGGQVTYQAVQEMRYLDMVVNETMRKYPTLTQLLRRCVKPFTFPDGRTVEKGDRMLIPLWSLHRDPKYFPKPEVFDPERFSPENRDSIDPFVYMPFGEGPRMCIGSRFGLLQTKMGILTVVQKYKIGPTPGIENLEFDPKSPVLTRPKGSITLNLTKRKIPT